VGRLRVRTLVVLGFLAAASMPAVAQEAAATVTCKDGSSSKAGKGACSHHGGVAKGEAPAPRNDNATPPAATQRTSPPPSHSASTRSAPTPPVPGKPTAKCKDGSLSYSMHHTGSCSHHGGVAQWLDGSQ
jgi:uncharacterized protein DUF3761